MFWRKPSDKNRPEITQEKSVSREPGIAEESFVVVNGVRTNSPKLPQEYVDAHLSFVEKFESGNPERLEKMKAYDAVDLREFRLEVERFGDFLVLKCARVTGGGSLEEPDIDKVAKTINLGKTTRIEVTSGRDIVLTQQKPIVNARGYSGDGPIIRDLQEIEFIPYDNVVGERTIFSDKPDTNHHFPYWSRDHITIGKTRYSLSALPRVSVYAQSENDVITFYGIDLRLSVPFGMGWEIHTKIMNAIREGYEPPENSVLSRNGLSQK